jgi:FKBP-type peptidyl-prolyl cis-trans isomerase
MKLALLALALASPLLGSCHFWGFHRPVDLPTPIETTTASGVRWVDLREGRGVAVGPRSRVTVDYAGKLEDGTLVDSSELRGGPLVCTLGRNEVMPGWEDGLVGMREGGRRRLTIPPSRAFGDEGVAGVIPPRATLVFEIELLKVE